MYLEMLYNIFNRAEDNRLMTKSAVANKAFRRLAEKFISPYSLPRPKTVLTGIRYSDLNTPLRERVTRKLFQDPVESSLEQSYKDYLARVFDRDPRIARYADVDKKLERADAIRYRLYSNPNNNSARQLQRNLKESANSYLAREFQSRIIPRFTMYKAKTPYATTHHLADGEASLAANKAAQNAPAGTRLIENPNPDAGWNNYRSKEFRVNTPGAPWSPEELELMRTSSNLSDTNLYETVFSRVDRNFPNAIATYVPDTPEIRQALALKPGVKGVPIDELQSKLQGTLYRGKNIDTDGMLQAYNSYKNAVRHYVPDRFKKSTEALWPTFTAESGAPERWFAPAARTSMGYVGANDAQKFIRLDSNALQRLRGMEHPTVPTNIPELESYTDADWANLFRFRHQNERLINLMERLSKQRDNIMPRGLYTISKGYAPI